jgi:hypothetical protein
LEELERLAETAADDGLEELLLRPEQAEHVRLRDPSLRRDRLRGRAGEAAPRELVQRGVEDCLTPFRGRLSFGDGCHAE